MTIAREKTAAGKVPRVRQVAYIVNRAHKPATLARILDMEDPVATLVFCRTRMEVESLVETFNAHGHRSEALHGGMVQRQRDRVMGLFRAQKADLLIATDVAARGLDIEHLSHVVNYDVPASPEAYLHRIGRTGRAGRGGTAITLAEPREHRLLSAIENFTRGEDRGRRRCRRSPTCARGSSTSRARRCASGCSPATTITCGSSSSRSRRSSTSSTSRRRRWRWRTRRRRATARRARDSRRRRGRARRSHGDAEPDGERLAAGQDKARGWSRRGAGGAAGGRRDGPMVRLFVGAGRKAGIRPGDLVGAITGEAGVTSRSLGAIEIADKFSLVEVPEALADEHHRRAQGDEDSRQEGAGAPRS